MTYETAKARALNGISPRVGERRESKNLGIVVEVLSINGPFVTVNAHGLGVLIERTTRWTTGTGTLDHLLPRKWGGQAR